MKPYAKRIAVKGAICLSAAMQYLCAEVIDISGNMARQDNKMRIDARHIQLAVRTDQALNKMLANVLIASGGFVPNTLRDPLMTNADKRKSC